MAQIKKTLLNKMPTFVSKKLKKSGNAQSIEIDPRLTELMVLLDQDVQKIKKSTKQELADSKHVAKKLEQLNQEKQEKQEVINRLKKQNIDQAENYVKELIALANDISLEHPKADEMHGMLYELEDTTGGARVRALETFLEKLNAVKDQNHPIIEVNAGCKARVDYADSRSKLRKANMEMDDLKRQSSRTQQLSEPQEVKKLQKELDKIESGRKHKEILSVKFIDFISPKTCGDISDINEGIEYYKAQFKAVAKQHKLNFTAKEIKQVFALYHSTIADVIKQAQEKAQIQVQAQTLENEKAPQKLKMNYEESYQHYLERVNKAKAYYKEKLPYKPVKTIDKFKEHPNLLANYGLQLDQDRRHKKHTPTSFSEFQIAHEAAKKEHPQRKRPDLMQYRFSPDQKPHKEEKKNLQHTEAKKKRLN